MDCIFCKIAAKQIPSAIVYENEDVIAFRDINPQAPVHIIIIPKQHIATLNDITPADAQLIGKIVLAAQVIAKDNNLHNPGYRLVLNCNKDAGQTVFHIHCHLLGGRLMGWPPG